jgi:hypothetical protein
MPHHFDFCPQGFSRSRLRVRMERIARCISSMTGNPRLSWQTAIVTRAEPKPRPWLDQNIGLIIRSKAP